MLRRRIVRRPTCGFGGWWWCPLLYAFWATLAWLFRQFHKPPISGRYLFADCQYKHRYRPFYDRYRALFLELRAKRRGRS